MNPTSPRRRPTSEHAGDLLMALALMPLLALAIAGLWVVYVRLSWMSWPAFAFVGAAAYAIGRAPPQTPRRQPHSTR